MEESLSVADFDDVLRTDVLIVGAGGAGLRAAIEAAKHPVDVTLICKGRLGPGGCTPMSSGFFQAPVLASDNPETHFRDTVVGGEFLNNQNLTWVFSTEAYRSLLDLENYGFVFERVEPNKYMSRHFGSLSQVRGAQNMNAMSISATLIDEALHRGVRILEDTVITSLVKSVDSIAGATAVDMKDGRFIVFETKSIVLASGSLGQLFKRSTASRYSTGDGLALAIRAGATLVDLEIIQPLPLSFVFGALNGMTFSPAEYFGPKVEILNRLGERFMKKYDPVKIEFTTYAALSRANFLEIREGRGTINGGVIVDPTKNSKDEAMTFKKLFYRRWKKIKECYGEKAANWDEPFEAAPTMWGSTGGIDINEKCETAVRGLYAAGEIVGGVHGANRLSGNSLTETQVFGKIAGDQAARFTLKAAFLDLDQKVVKKERNRVFAPLNRNEGVRASTVKEELQNVMWEKVGIVRSESSLTEAMRDVSHIKEEAIPKIVATGKSKTYNEEWLDAIEALNMIDLAEMIIGGSLMRRESRGAYYREDYPKRDDRTWLRHIVYRMDSGVLSTTTRSVELQRLKP